MFAARLVLPVFAASLVLPGSATSLAHPWSAPRHTHPRSPANIVNLKHDLPEAIAYRSELIVALVAEQGRIAKILIDGDPELA
jgi:hypothetical protein